MKRFIFLILIFAFAAPVFGCRQNSTFSEFDTEGDVMTLTRGDVTVTVDASSGMVKKVENSYDSQSLEGIFVDAGIDGESVFQQIGYKDMSTLATYELPTLYTRMKEITEYNVDAITATQSGFTVSITCGDYNFLYEYRILSNALAMEVTVSTLVEQQVAVNGVGFLVRGLTEFTLEDTTYEFPGSTPAGQHSFSATTKYRITCADYSASAVTVTDGSKSSNILFVDEVEKWTTGCYYDENERPCVAFLAAVEGWLTTSTPMVVGTLYIPLKEPETDAYEAISDFWAELGYHTPIDTTSTENLVAIYSGHPYGTMDTGFSNHLTLDEYAETIDSIAMMGFDAIWLLPVFSHSGDNVYEPIDQWIIDSRYGGLEGATTFVNAAHALGMYVLFDFVPHGPRSVYSFAKEHDDWISKDKNGENQIEWECVSFDYNNPGYSAYNVALASYYAEILGLDGARIDCAMGGLSNWYSAVGLRASASGLQAGLQVISDLRQGFLDSGSDVLLLPENFHPSPAFASVTDVFYDMPLYRCIYDMRWKDLTETEYVAELTGFLAAEHGSSVSGQLKLRFLGNHDTVSWTYDSERAQTLYGVERAKAMWMAIGWIDGVLYIYQGDEDPLAYGLEGENLEDFFTQLISIKREYLPNSFNTAYIDTGSPVFAFYRYTEDCARLVLVNLSTKSQSYSLTETDSILAAIGDYSLSGSEIVLESYSGVVLDTVYQP